MTSASPEERRPSPKALLELAAKEQRGKLKVFLGMAPGVGKTYAMLQAAQSMKSQGVDVVVGVVETHGRYDTGALLIGLQFVNLLAVNATHTQRGFREHTDPVPLVEPWAARFGVDRVATVGITPRAMTETFGSSCHGAGRILSRTAALKRASGRRIERELAERGIEVMARGYRTLGEEMSEAYKDVADVVDVIDGAGISRKVAKLVPLCVIKG